MIGSSDFEKVFYLYVRTNPNYLKTVKKDFFENEEIGTLLTIDQTFFDRFKQTPTKDQLKAIAKQDKFVDQITDKIIDIVFDEPYDSYDPEWVRETSEAWILWKNLDQSLIDTYEFVKSVKVTPNNVNDIVSKVKNLINDRNSISFSQSIGRDFFDVESHIPEANSKITTGHNWVDHFTGGYRTKSLVVYAGEQNIGKCAHKDTLVSIRNKKTGDIQKIRIEDFYELIKKNN
jgi:hypothetical protein